MARLAYRKQGEGERSSLPTRPGAMLAGPRVGAVIQNIIARMRTVDLIRHKRDGGELDAAQIEHFVAGVTRGSIPDYQASALLMAIVLRGMTAAETTSLTSAMVGSGVRVTFTGLRSIPVDKHSTGGVGDKTSLVAAPLAVACGAVVPMMSGRGLGHTGGTLDKLESIPGFRTSLSLDEVRAAVHAVGAALVGQTAEIAPADRRLYALRDVTGTVESIPLISASIMSKKIAEGIGGLVLDVKVGAGAFMATTQEARTLAESLVTIGTAAGLRTEALITRMDDPLGRAVGNASEVRESIETLKGAGPHDLESLSTTLAAHMLVLSGVAGDASDAKRLVAQALSSGAGLDTFRRIIAHQGGDPRVIDDESLLPDAPGEHRILAARAGFVAGLHAGCIGRAAVALGAGRATMEDEVDPGVGIRVVAPRGTRVDAGDAVLIVRHRDRRGLADALPLLERAVCIGEEPPDPSPVVIEVVRAPTGTTEETP